MLTKEMLADSKPFIITVPREGSADIYLGCNIERKDGPTISVVALVKQTYLWGVGPEPLLPPMTELSVFDKTGESIMASQNGVRDNYHNLSKQRNFSNSNLRLSPGRSSPPPSISKAMTSFRNWAMPSTIWRQTEYLCLPISVDGVINRALILGWSKPPVFNEDLFSQARKIANQLAIAITNSLHLENLEKLATGTIEALARTVDAKSKWTSGHSERVAALGGRIGRALGLDAVAIDTITRGGLLHDIGKIGIPLAILDKPGRLSEQEYAEVKNHPAIGGKILEPISAFQDILPVVVQHHEKFDGTGYPEGLKGDEIDIRARILGVADVWDALVSSRPYREGWIHERARKCIVEESGTHFDPQVVNAFLAVLAEG